VREPAHTEARGCSADRNEPAKSHPTGGACHRRSADQHPPARSVSWAGAVPPAVSCRRASVVPRPPKPGKSPSLSSLVLRVGILPHVLHPPKVTHIEGAADGGGQGQCAPVPVHHSANTHNTPPTRRPTTCTTRGGGRPHPTCIDIPASPSQPGASPPPRACRGGWSKGKVRSMGCMA